MSERALQPWNEGPMFMQDSGMDTGEGEVHPLKTYQLICFTPSGRRMFSKDVQPQNAAFGSSGVEGGMLTLLRDVQS